MNDQREDLYAAQQSGVRIVKLGSKPQDRVYQGECTNCNTVVEFKRSAARYQSDQRDGDFLAVTCPVCKQSITVGV